MQWIMQTRTFSALMNCMPFVYTLKRYFNCSCIQCDCISVEITNKQTSNNAVGSNIWRNTVKMLNAFKMHTKSTISLNRCSRTVFVFHVVFFYLFPMEHIFLIRSNLIAKCEIVNVYVTYSEIHCWLDSITGVHTAHTTREIVFFISEKK